MKKSCRKLQKAMARNNSNNHHKDSDDKMFRIQIVSDLHLEFYGSFQKVPLNDIVQPRAPVLALLGDMGLACSDLLRQFLLEMSNQFEQVLFVAGNHEFYNHPRSTGGLYTVEQQLEWIRGVCKERPNLHFLERESIELGGVRILGTTLWSHIPNASIRQAQATLNDYQLSYISVRNGQQCGSQSPSQRMTAEYTNAWYQTSLQWLQQEIQQAKADGKPVVVLTHHTPSLKGTSDPQYNGSPVSCCFSSELVHLLRDPVKVWACGHTHNSFDWVVCDVDQKKLVPSSSSLATRVGGAPGTRLVSNQRGYPGVKKMDYDKEGLIVEVSSGS